jgi:hypothetical protein
MALPPISAFDLARHFLDTGFQSIGAVCFHRFDECGVRNGRRLSAVPLAASLAIWPSLDFQEHRAPRARLGTTV